jgi:glyoxylase-like metal-dependent hydrolase (beta-lactamase superfamily II)
MKHSGSESFSDVLKVGDLEVFAVPDTVARLPMPIRQVFASVPEADWPVHLERYPETVWGDGDFQVSVLGCVVLRRGGRTVLVDTGIGLGTGEVARRLGVRGELPSRLKEAGIAPEEVDTVFLTHLDPDHVGWNVQPETRQPFFPAARYVTHEAGWRYWSELAAASPEAAAHVVASVLPLAEAGRLDFVQGGEAVAPGMTTLETLGHSPGHTSLVVAADGRRLVLLGDSFAHPLQVAAPEHSHALDRDPRRAAATREGLVGLLAEDDVLTFAYHFPTPGFGRVAEEDGRRVWRPLAPAPA